ncbi:putative Acyl CoA binding protein [Taphrina deformans PYCC 5710]|uniref:Acyl CoA binding protein n=1 Tax=Taphrina deformans (strain PYCC 5710 / ATCC 11124 / CBS 356.35 / IMI 108563 / JCM 9778 / NBRC 8474) TaxID=1097556 RepID=R4X6A2_TAPDE|nr:putative Acyl CoA binding protein [Taphrina deformans PYCC 5710]|eukprot:CCG80520.1 putative Acyl CoA binding protein [Taphrina deformans PYCC 5710]
MNGIDRVFVSALNTVKRLPSSPSSPKPPLDERLLLYGLFKQSMEGDIPQSMLQTLQSDPIDEEDDANREKTEAWAEQKGTTKTEAKKLYITTLIRSMRQYGSKTETAKSLIDELEFVWNQVNGNNDESSPLHSRSNSGSHANLVGQQEDDDDDDDERRVDLDQALPIAYRTAPPSPSKALQPQKTGESRSFNPVTMLLGGSAKPSTTLSQDEKWKRQVEQALQQIRAELASVRESLLITSPSASSLFSKHNTYHQQSLLTQVLSRMSRLLRVSLTVALYDIIFLLGIWYFFRRRGDKRAKRVEEWVRNLYDWTLRKIRMKVRTGVRSIGDRR